MEVQNRPPSIKFHLDEKKLRKSPLTRGVGGVSFVDQSIKLQSFFSEGMAPSALSHSVFFVHSLHSTHSIRNGKICNIQKYENIFYIKY